MATILNEDVLPNVYIDYHPDLNKSDYSDAPDMDHTLQSDNGRMSKEMESVVVAAAAADQLDNRRGCKSKKKWTYQYNTKNTSFIELHNDLKKLGVENNKFFLKLYDADLMDVDPYAMILPLELQAKIIVECIRNPWYFLREVVRIPVDGKPICPGGGMAFKADRNNIACWYLFLHGIDHYSSKPRQLGKTQNALSMINYAYHFGCMSSTITLANKDFTLNKMNLSRLKIQRDMLPMYMQMKVMIGEEKIIKEQSNVTTMGNPINHNKIQLLPTAATEAKAPGIGRGLTSNIQMFDEFDWMKYNMEIIYASVFAFNTASDNAKANHSLYGRIFTSTPGNMDTPEGIAADKFINGDAEDGSHSVPMLKWKDKYFDMPIEKLRAQVNSKSYNGIVFVEHSWQQLKCSNAWYEKACRGVSYNDEQIAREILLKRLRGSKKSPFKRQYIMYLLNNCMTPNDEVDMSDNLSPIYFYEKLNKRTPYIVAIDPAEGLSGDNMAMVVINPYTEKVAAEFASPNINQTKMAKMVVRFLDKFCPRSMLVIENNRGREIINRLLETYYADHIWFDVDKLNGKETINTKDLDADAEKALGWNTGPTSRQLIMSTIQTIVEEEPTKANSKLVVDDICALERNPRTGKIAAAQGKHDDVIMAFGMGHTVLRIATNLSNWGIIRGMRENENGEPNDPNYAINMIMSMAKSLPDSVRKVLFGDIGKSVEEDDKKNREELIKADARYRMAEDERRSDRGEDVDYDPYDAGAEAAMDEDFYNAATYNPDANFDIGDYL